MMKNILVVGSGSTRNLTVVQDLRDSGYRVEEVSVQESIDILQQREEIDLVIIGVSLGESSAFSLAKLARENGIRLFVMPDGVARQRRYADAGAPHPAPDSADEAVEMTETVGQDRVIGRIYAA